MDTRMDMDTGSQEWIADTIEKIREKMAWVSEKNKDQIPYTTDEHGDYDDRSDESINWNIENGLNWWTNGFWGGIMWLLYQDTKEQRYLDIARVCGSKLERTLLDFYGLHHDVGFMFVPTAVADYRITGNMEAKRTALHAANLLAGRFNPQGNYIRAWNDTTGQEDNRGWAIIDCMFNISLLYWASRETNDPRYRQIAMRHADSVMEHFIRPDGSSIHIGEFHPETGAFVKSHRGQGFDEESAWTRGQGWALYGFINSYINTGKREYLDTAKKVAHYCIANIPESGHIPIDFRQPVVPALEDSCGACVIAGGFIELAKHVEGTKRQIYLRSAVKILKAITDTRAEWSRESDAIVRNCSTTYHEGGHHITMVYADYFYIEAIYKLGGIGTLLW